MSASVETLSPSKPFNNENNDDQNKMKNKEMMNENMIKQEEVEENEGKCKTNVDDGEDDDLASKCDKALDSSPNDSSLMQIEKDKNVGRRLQKWKDQNIQNLDVRSLEDTKLNQSPEVEIISILIICRGRPEIVLSEPFASSPKACLFTLKEGSRYRLRFNFIVSNKTVSGLKYVNTLWKAGVRVDRSEALLGSFSPKEEPYTYELEEDTAPSGIFVRGLYCARTKVVDDHENCYLDIKYYFEIQKTWPSCS